MPVHDIKKPLILLALLLLPALLLQWLLGPRFVMEDGVLQSDSWRLPYMPEAEKPEILLEKLAANGRWQGSEELLAGASAMDSEEGAGSRNASEAPNRLDGHTLVGVIREVGRYNPTAIVIAPGGEILRLREGDMLGTAYRLQSIGPYEITVDAIDTTTTDDEAETAASLTLKLYPEVPSG